MLKKIIALSALAASSFAHAEVKDLKVVYKGFFDARTQAFDSNLRLEAFFKVDDLNRDGTYSYDEVIRFTGGGVTYEGGCGEHPVMYDCLSSFSYTPGSNPTFTAGYHVSDEMFYISRTLIAGQYFEDYYSGMTRGYYRKWNWTSETQTYILSAVQAVPEPAQYGMLSLGLIGMLAAVRRRA